MSIVHASQTYPENMARQMIRSGADFAAVNVSGGIPRQTYYRPDGVVVKAIAQMRNYVVKDKDGKITSQGTRDANLDNGWTLTKPANPKLTCEYCGRWHDTQAEIKKCKIQTQKRIALAEKQARAEMEQEEQSKDAQIADLTAKLEALTKLVEDKLGKG